ncbi:MAG: hypothetical protein KDD22_07360, partial [Bdellovibrionales bacterium]|nr:hypothetical protein [Bdellovibrionales bacterium]
MLKKIILILLAINTDLTFSMTPGSVFTTFAPVRKIVIASPSDLLSPDDLDGYFRLFVFGYGFRNVEEFNSRIKPIELIENAKFLTAEEKKSLSGKITSKSNAFDTYRYLSLQRYPEYNSQFCSGTFISDRVYVTAAHCVLNTLFSFFKVNVGLLKTFGWINLLDSEGHKIVAQADEIYLPENAGGGRVDWAYVIFPPNTSRDWIEIAPDKTVEEIVTRIASAQHEMQGRIYGFGVREFRPSLDAPPGNTSDKVQMGTLGRLSYIPELNSIAGSASLDAIDPDTAKNNCTLY